MSIESDLARMKKDLERAKVTEVTPEVQAQWDEEDRQAAHEEKVQESRRRDEVESSVARCIKRLGHAADQIFALQPDSPAFVERFSTDSNGRTNDGKTLHEAVSEALGTPPSAAPAGGGGRGAQLREDLQAAKAEVERWEREFKQSRGSNSGFLCKRKEALAKVANLEAQIASTRPPAQQPAPKQLSASARAELTALIAKYNASLDRAKKNPRNEHFAVEASALNGQLQQLKKRLGVK